MHQTKYRRGFFKAAFYLFVFSVLGFLFGSFIFTNPVSGKKNPSETMLLPTGATKVDSLAVDVDGDGRADPGDTIQYTVTIPNTTATSGTGMKFTDTLESNLTL